MNQNFIFKFLIFYWSLGGGGGGGGGGGIPPPFPEITLTSTGLDKDELCFLAFSFSKLPIILFISILLVFPSHNSTIGLDGPLLLLLLETEFEVEELEPPPPAILAWRKAILAAKLFPVFIGGLAWLFTEGFGFGFCTLEFLIIVGFFVSVVGLIVFI